MLLCLCDTHIRFARAAITNRLEVHHSRLAAVVMCMLMIVAVGIAMIVAVSMRVVVAVVFCRKRQCVFLSAVTFGR